MSSYFIWKCFPAVKYEPLSGSRGLPPGPSGSVISFHVALSCFPSALVVKLALRKPDEVHKMKQKHQNKQQDSQSFQYTG